MSPMTIILSTFWESSMASFCLFSVAEQMVWEISIFSPFSRKMASIIVKLALGEGCLHHNGVSPFSVSSTVRLCLLRAFQNNGCIAAPAVNALYLRVLNDLWAVDEGLNSDITMLSVDLSQTGLSDSEQAAVAWVFGGMHDISETMTMSYEELAAEGYLTGTEPDSDGIPCWEDGCLFTITEQNGQDSIHVEQDSKNITGADPLPRTEEKSGAACQLPPAEAGQGQSDFCPVKTKSGEPDALQNTVTFDAQKWRSALGAYFFTDCTASRDAQGHWGDYTVGAAAIS